MSHYIDKKISSYSLGMRQRLAFAMVLVTTADLLLLDEVMGSQDPTNVEMVSVVLREEVAKGKTILLASHILDNLEIVADKIIFLKDKQLVLGHDPHEQIIERLEVIVKREEDWYYVSTHCTRLLCQEFDSKQLCCDIRNWVT